MLERLKKVYQDDFESVTLDEAKDGALVICKDTTKFSHKNLFIRGRKVSEVAKVKFNVDDGGEYLKFLLQFIFEDDPLLTQDFSGLEKHKNAGDGNMNLLESGVDRVLVLASARGVKESNGVVCRVTNMLNITELRQLFQVSCVQDCFSTQTLSRTLWLARLLSLTRAPSLSRSVFTLSARSSNHGSFLF